VSTVRARPSTSTSTTSPSTTRALRWRRRTSRIGRDVALGEHPGGDLVQERLEEVVVGPVDDHHLHRRPPQRLRGEQPREAAADDDDAVHASDPRSALASCAARSALSLRMYAS
jgi:hypothetical protein